MSALSRLTVTQREQLSQALARRIHEEVMRLLFPAAEDEGEAA